jgi:hypothetical protein
VAVDVELVVPDVSVLPELVPVPEVVVLTVPVVKAVVPVPVPELLPGLKENDELPASKPNICVEGELEPHAAPTSARRIRECVEYLGSMAGILWRARWRRRHL